MTPIQWASRYRINKWTALNTTLSRSVYRLYANTNWFCLYHVRSCTLYKIDGDAPSTTIYDLRSLGLVELYSNITAEDTEEWDIITYSILLWYIAASS